MGGCCSAPQPDQDGYGGGRRQPADPEQDATGGLSDMYEVKHLLGSGSAGDTWLCRDRGSGELLAVKLMKRPIPRVMGANIIREVKIGAALGRGHLNIVKPKELILTRTHLGIVMEYVAGGNMADYILKTILLKFGSFDTRDGLVMEEDEARYFFTQVINAVEYCHQNKVAHRDLKMDNTLLDDNDPPRVKLCDFGFAKWWTDKPCMCTITGTPDYMSPELLGAKAQHQAQALYDGTKADIWAAGVMLCVMLIGRFPFEGIEMSNATNLEEVSEHVWHQQKSECWYENPLIAQDCSMLSPDCMDLLNKIFNLDSDERITISGIRQHAWFQQALQPPYSQALTDLLAEQKKIEEQVLSGAFVSSNRDVALSRMVDAASARYTPEADQAFLQAEAAQQALARGQAQAAGGGGGGSGLARLSASMLRKISLTSIKHFHQEDACGTSHSDVAHVSLNTVSERFATANGKAADGEQQEQQQADSTTGLQQQQLQLVGGRQQSLQQPEPLPHILQQPPSPLPQQQQVAVEQQSKQWQQQLCAHQQQHQQQQQYSSGQPPGQPPGVAAGTAVEGAAAASAAAVTVAATAAGLSGSSPGQPVSIGEIEVG